MQRAFVFTRVTSGGCEPYSEKLRVFACKTGGGIACIDFTMHTLAPGCLYIVPPRHCIYMSDQLQADCICAEVDPGTLPDNIRCGLLRLQFALQKQVPVMHASSLSGEADLTDALLQSLPGTRQPGARAGLKAASRQWYRELASSFCTLVERCRPGQKQSAVPDLATALCQHEKTVRRACLETFTVSPAKIVRYHVVLAAVRFLAETNLRLESIAEKLDFADAGKCTRFLKGKMGLCPTEFRRLVGGLRGENSPKIVRKW